MNGRLQLFGSQERLLNEPVLGIPVPINPLQNEIEVEECVDKLARHPIVFALSPERSDDDKWLGLKGQTDYLDKRLLACLDWTELLPAEPYALEVPYIRILRVAIFEDDGDGRIPPVDPPDRKEYRKG